MRVFVGICTLAALLAVTASTSGEARSGPRAPSTTASAPLTFAAGCATGDRATLAAVGDLLFHDAVQARALAPGRSFRALWAPLLPVLEGADLSYGNLEGPAARGVRIGGIAVDDPGRRLDGIVYGRSRGALVFNYHPSVIGDLAASGFKVLSTANNHAADRGPLGIDRTIDELAAHELAYSGTRRRGDALSPWGTIVAAAGMKIGWLACTYSTNGMPDKLGQVLNCYANKAAILDEVRRMRAGGAADAVIVAPHWGHEGSHVPLKADRAWAREMIEAGAAAIVGTHPHVLQPWERVTASDGREGLVIYSTGNFISNQRSLTQRTGIVALVELVRGAGGAVVSAAGFIPTWVDIEGGHVVREMPVDRADALRSALRLLAA
ncbi:MAG TPA: CapA family protein, partial [Hyphomicrobiaceae bacterium]|nr:CapA family protein [Hyphomicrobiaceae bacterium]